ncbi:MAG: DNA-binding response regulator [Planctomycetes bacterium]|nr:DNA-binding response regulator [Planctomycetota bacterium]
MTRILLVEDEPRLARSLVMGLRDEQFVVDHAEDGEQALWLAESGQHAAVLLDLRIPKLDGLEVCRRLRAAGSTVPILMLTACDTTEEIVQGLNLGADDYLTKPFQFAEMLARLRAVLRRPSGRRSPRLQVADLELDPSGQRVWRAGQEILLSNLEYRVLEHLMRHAGSVQSRARIAAAVWQDELGPESNVLEVIISHLRRKLDQDHDQKLLHTRRGAGYVLSEAHA